MAKNIKKDEAKKIAQSSYNEHDKKAADNVPALSQKDIDTLGQLKEQTRKNKLRKVIATSLPDKTANLADDQIIETLDDYGRSILEMHLGTREASQQLTGLNALVTGDTRMSRPDFVRNRRIGKPRYLGQNPYLNTFDAMVASNRFMVTGISERIPNRRLLTEDEYKRSRHLTQSFKTYNDYKDWTSVTAGYGHVKVSQAFNKDADELTRKALDHVSQLINIGSLKHSTKSALERTTKSARTLGTYITSEMMHNGPFDRGIIAQNQRGFLVDSFAGIVGTDASRLSNADIEDKLIDTIQLKINKTDSIVKQALESGAMARDAQIERSLYELKEKLPRTRSKFTADDNIAIEQSLERVRVSLQLRKKNIGSIRDSIIGFEGDVTDKIVGSGRLHVRKTLHNQIMSETNAELERLAQERQVFTLVFNSTPEFNVPVMDPKDREKIDAFRAKRSLNNKQHLDEAVRETRRRAAQRLIDIRRELGPLRRGRTVGAVSHINGIYKLMNEVDDAMAAYHSNPCNKTLTRLVGAIQSYSVNGDLNTSIVEGWAGETVRSFNKFNSFHSARGDIADGVSNYVQDAVKVEDPVELLRLSRELRTYDVYDGIDGKDVLGELGFSKQQKDVMFADTSDAIEHVADQLELLARVRQKEQILKNSSHIDKNKLIKINRRIKNRHMKKKLVANKTRYRAEVERVRDIQRKLRKSKDVNAVVEAIEHDIQRVEKATGGAQTFSNATDAALADTKQQNQTMLDKSAEQILAEQKAAFSREFYNKYGIGKHADQYLAFKDIKYKREIRKFGITFRKEQGIHFGDKKRYDFSSHTNEVIREFTSADTELARLSKLGELNIDTFADKAISARVRALSKIYFTRSMQNTSKAFQEIALQGYRPGMFRSLRYVFSVKKREAISNDLARAYAQFMNTKLGTLFNEHYGTGDALGSMIDLEFNDAVTKHRIFSGINTTVEVKEADPNVAESVEENIVNRKFNTITSIEDYDQMSKTVAKKLGLKQSDLDLMVKKLIYQRNRLLSVGSATSDEALSEISSAIKAFSSGNDVEFRTAYELADVAVKKSTAASAYAGKLKNMTSRGLMAEHLGKLSQWTVGPVLVASSIVGVALGAMAMASDASKLLSQKIEESRKFDFGSGAALTTQSIGTERQYAEKRMRESRMGARSYLGREAQLLAY